MPIIKNGTEHTKVKSLLDYSSGRQFLGNLPAGATGDLLAAENVAVILDNSEMARIASVLDVSLTYSPSADVYDFDPADISVSWSLAPSGNNAQLTVSVADVDAAIQGLPYILTVRV